MRRRPGPARAFVRRRPGAPTSIGACSGSFLEHLGRAVYTGVYRARVAAGRRQGLPHRRGARGQGARRARSSATRAATSSPATTGSTASARRRSGRRVLERAWNSIETNQFGTNEFIDWCRLVGTEPLLGMNFGTGTRRDGGGLRRVLQPSSAARSGATCGARTATSSRTTCATGASATRWTARGRSGRCRRASTAARRATRPSRCASSIRNLQLIACGSSGTFMPTYLVWDREVLEECYDQVDGISLHAYYGNTTALTGNSTRAVPRDEPRHGSPHPRGGGGVRLRAGRCSGRASACGCRSTSGTSGTARATATATDGRRAAAPKLLEEVYNLEDALLVGGFVNTLLRNSDRVRVACLAQLVNVIAPLVTNDQRRAAPEHLLPVRVGAPLRAGPRARPARRVRDVSDHADRPAGGLRPRRRRAVRRRRRHARRAGPPGRASWCSTATSTREREVVLEWDDVDADARARLRDAHGPDLKAFNTFDAAAARRAAARSTAPAAGSADDVQAAAALVHRRASRRLTGVGVDAPAGCRLVLQRPSSQWLSHGRAPTAPLTLAGIA